MSTDDTYAARVRAARAYAKLDLDKLAKPLPFSWRTLSRIESGTRTLRVPEALIVAETTGVPLWFLLYGWDGWEELIPRDGERPSGSPGPQGRLARRLADRQTTEADHPHNGHSEEEGKRRRGAG